MDFFKNNLFYILLVAAVLVISIPSYIIAAAKEDRYKKAMADAKTDISGIQAQADALKPVTEEAIKKADLYSKEWQAQWKEADEAMRSFDKHLDYDFIEPVAPGSDLPPAEKYKVRYSLAYDELANRLSAFAVAGKPPLDKKDDWGDLVPGPNDIRFTQKKYWMLKEFTDVLLDPACHVTRIVHISVDAVPGAGQNHPNNPANPAESTFWLYPARLDFQIDFRYFPIFLRKIVDDQNLLIVPDGYQMTRAVAESEPVYTQNVTVTLYCMVWDYISTGFEKSLLKSYHSPAAAGAKGKQGGGGAAAGS